MNERKTTNTLLLFIVIPLVFYILKVLDFIFIPLISAMFIALVFLPLMRWLKSKNSPKFINISIVILIIVLGFKIFGELIQLSSKEILAANNDFFDNAKLKLADLIGSLESFFGVDFLKGEDALKTIVSRESVTKNLFPTIDFVSGTLSMLLTTLFFVLLLLADSIDVEKMLNATVLKRKTTSIRTFRKVEKDLVTFIKVKFLVSLGTGVGIGIACWGFGVSFPIFWGLFAFLINFVQMIGSVICVVVLAIFAFVDLELGPTLAIFVLSISGVQALFGGVLEPIYMGKSFAINVVTILVSLMLWGFIWGIPGLIMSIPITVFLKILMEQFPNTKPFAQFLSGKPSS